MPLGGFCNTIITPTCFGFGAHTDFYLQQHRELMLHTHTDYAKERLRALLRYDIYVIYRHTHEWIKYHMHRYAISCMHFLWSSCANSTNEKRTGRCDGVKNTARAKRCNWDSHKRLLCARWIATALSLLHLAWLVFNSACLSSNLWHIGGGNQGRPQVSYDLTLISISNHTFT